MKTKFSNLMEAKSYKIHFFIFEMLISHWWRLRFLLAAIPCDRFVCFSSRFYLYPTLFVIHTRRFITHPQAMRKLNPTNKPRTPPQSARRELRGNANSSLLTRILLLTNIGHTSVVPLICFFNIAAS